MIWWTSSLLLLLMLWVSFRLLCFFLVGGESGGGGGVLLVVVNVKRIVFKICLEALDEYIVAVVKLVVRGRGVEFGLKR